MQQESLAKRYRVHFVRNGQAFEFHTDDPVMSEARAWFHVARHLRIPVNDLQGFQLLYHTIRRHVEAHNVRDVSFEEAAG